MGVNGGFISASVGKITEAFEPKNFPAEVLCASEQEADIHGIAYGQRIIDGKVKGLSMMDLKPEDRRATPRFRVQFRTTFSASPNLEGTGILLDLSAGGCRIESTLTPEPGSL